MVSKEAGADNGALRTAQVVFFFYFLKFTRGAVERGILFCCLRIIIEARENKGFVCTEEVWGYCTLTNEINAGGYLYLSWYSKGNLGSVCRVAD